MSKSKKIVTETDPVSTTIKRGRGRPASFPDQETKAILSTIPVENISELRNLSIKWEVNINQALARVIAKANKDAFRVRATKAKAKAKVNVEA